MITSAKPKRGDVLADLGCGEGTVLWAAAEDYRIKKIFGLEANDNLLKKSRKVVNERGLGNKIKILNRDLTKLNLFELNPLPTIVTMYFTWGGAMWLKEKLEKGLEDGSRVVSNRSEITGWKPVETIYPQGTGDSVYVYEMGYSEL
jgi:ubiquinone/menaquinone biosynthesis C-methylase UbiE